MSRSSIPLAVAIAGAVFAFAGRTAKGEPPPANLVQAKLIADTTAVKAGQPFTIGVLLEIAPKWHVYWSNPGDSGVATSVKFTVPDGFSVGELQYPTPVRFNEPGDLISYGYTGSVLLTAKVTPPADLKGKDKVQMSAAAKWLVCHDICLPGDAKVGLTLAVSEAPAPAEQETFRQWAARLPVDAGASPDVAKLEWGADPKPGEATLVVTWKPAAKDAKGVSIFPAADDSADVRAVSVKQEGDRTTVVVQVKPLAGQKQRTGSLPAVLGYSTAAGDRRGVNTAVPAGAFASGAGK